MLPTIQTLLGSSLVMYMISENIYIYRRPGSYTTCTIQKQDLNALFDHGHIFSCLLCIFVWPSAAAVFWSHFEVLHNFLPKKSLMPVWLQPALLLLVGRSSYLTAAPMESLHRDLCFECFSSISCSDHRSYSLYRLETFLLPEIKFVLWQLLRRFHLNVRPGCYAHSARPLVSTGEALIKLHLCNKWRHFVFENEAFDQALL